MADKYIEHGFFMGDCRSAPIVHCSANKGDVTISWTNPADKYRNLEIIPPIDAWSERDGIMYDIGKIVMEHFLTEDKDQ